MEIQRIKLSAEERNLLFDFMGEDPGPTIDFNWLMPVVEKISKTKPMNQAWFDVKYHLIDARMPVVYERVVEFIKWYRTQNTNEPIVWQNQ